MQANKNLENTIINMIRDHATKAPRSPAFTFLDHSLIEREVFDYGELYSLSLKSASFISKFARTGDRAILMMPSGPELVLALLGCMYSGIVAVPVHLATSSNPSKWKQLCSVIDNCQAASLITLENYSGEAAVILTNIVESLEIVTFSLAGIANENPSPPRPHIGPDTLALLQYTSGSIGNPKGVKIKHANITANMEFIRSCGNYDQDTIFCSWVPLQHDLGLMANLLQAFFVGAHIILMSPLTFVRKPISWLKAISKYRATASGAPCFAYDLCAQRVSEEEARELDLSSWIAAFVGAEPIRASTLKRFSRKFEPYKFDELALYPAYGMAESTLLATGSVLGKGAYRAIFDIDKLGRDSIAELKVDNEASKGIALVSSGIVRDDQNICIVDPETRSKLGAGRVGEIWINSPSISEGYWEDTIANKETFGMAINDGTGSYFRSGDLGFILDKRIYITGRLKDLMIIHGVNIHPHDIEETVQHCSDKLTSNSGAVFSVNFEDEERVVITQEVNRSVSLQEEFSELVSRIQSRVISIHQVWPLEIILVRAASIPKTSSGKIQRKLAQKHYFLSTLKVKFRKQFTKGHYINPKNFSNYSGGWSNDDRGSDL